MVKHDDPALYPALLFYSLGAYPRMEGLSEVETSELALAVTDFTAEVPVGRGKDGKFPRRELPIFGSVSVVEAVAIGGSILVLNQVKGGFEEHLAGLCEGNSILRACYDAWKMGKRGENKPEEKARA